MILVVSRFRVANGMEAAVEAAFLNRPRLVDNAPGFLGMETFTGSSDATLFYLVTRWTDAESFHVWHKSKEHRLSHRFIPKGLKLDPQFTQLLVMDRLNDCTRSPDLNETVADSLSLVTEFLSESRTVIYIVSSIEGTVLLCNEAVSTQLNKPAAEMLGHKLWDSLTEHDAALLQRKVSSGELKTREKLLLNFTNSQLHPITIECHLQVRPDGFVLVGAPPLDKEQAFREELISLNNQLTVLMRENTRQSKALKRAHTQLEETHAELRQSHWHLRKIQEVLPICMMCQKVKTGADQWEELIKFFKDNSDFLSHGYCPDCGKKMMAQLEKLKR